MKKIAIIGAGQSGLQLSLSLLKYGYLVTLFSDRKAIDILNGKVMSSQCMFNNAIEIERQQDLALWEEDVPFINHFQMNISQNDMFKEPVSWASSYDFPSYSVDQRIKLPALMDMFVFRGGNLIIKSITLSDMISLSENHDLVIVATGNKLLSSAFEINEKESPFNCPQRSLALTYVKNMDRPSDVASFNICPGVGEYVTFPALTVKGECDIMVFEGVPSGPMDCWSNVQSPEEHLATSLRILNDWFPSEAQRCSQVSLTDQCGFLTGSITPVVRKPVMTLPNGKKILGMGDTVVLNDSITGQGANSAAKCAEIYFKSILDNTGPFDQDWMEDTFAKFWDYAAHVVRWTNSLLIPPSTHIASLLSVASTDKVLAKKIVDGFDDPKQLYPWWYGE